MSDLSALSGGSGSITDGNRKLQITDINITKVNRKLQITELTLMKRPVFMMLLLEGCRASWSCELSALLGDTGSSEFFPLLISSAHLMLSPLKWSGGSGSSEFFPSLEGGGFHKDIGKNSFIRHSFD